MIAVEKLLIIWVATTSGVGLGGRRGTDPFGSSRSRPVEGLSLRGWMGQVAGEVWTVVAVEKLLIIRVETTSGVGWGGPAGDRPFWVVAVAAC